MIVAQKWNAPFYWPYFKHVYVWLCAKQIKNIICSKLGSFMSTWPNLIPPILLFPHVCVRQWRIKAWWVAHDCNNSCFPVSSIMNKKHVLASCLQMDDTRKSFKFFHWALPHVCLSFAYPTSHKWQNLPGLPLHTCGFRAIKDWSW